MTDEELDWIRDHLKMAREGDRLLRVFLGIGETVRLDNLMQLSDQEIDRRIDDLIDERNRRDGLILVH